MHNYRLSLLKNGCLDLLPRDLKNVSIRDHLMEGIEAFQCNAHWERSSLLKSALSDRSKRICEERSFPTMDSKNSMPVNLFSCCHLQILAAIKFMFSRKFDFQKKFLFYFIAATLKQKIFLRTFNMFFNLRLSSSSLSTSSSHWTHRWVNKILLLKGLEKWI